MKTAPHTDTIDLEPLDGRGHLTVHLDDQGRIVEVLHHRPFPFIEFVWLLPVGVSVFFAIRIGVLAALMIMPVLVLGFALWMWHEARTLRINLSPTDRAEMQDAIDKLQLPSRATRVSDAA